MPDDYEVGYGKPPKHTRFRKGRSGNPSGGRKPRQTLGQLFDHALHETVVVTEHGQRRKMTKLQLVISQMINKAAGGDPKSLRLFLDVIGRFPPEAPSVRLDRDDQEFLNQIIEEAKRLDDEC
jgi:hypothetical protein